MVKKRGLSRGLDALLGEEKGLDNLLNPSPDRAQNNLLHIGLDKLQRGVYQPRRDIKTEALEELAASIKQYGVMQPIVARLLDSGQYEIIAGERRWRAAQIAQLDTIPTVVKQVDDQTTIALALIENIQREDLNVVEEALALQRLQAEFEMTQQQVAEAVGKSRSAVANSLRLLQLDEQVKILLERGDLDMGHARCLLSLDAKAQNTIAREIVAKDLSVRQTEALVQQQRSHQLKPSPKQLDANTHHLQEKLSELIGSAVQVKSTSKSAGHLNIQYSSLDQLDGIIKRLDPEGKLSL